MPITRATPAEHYPRSKKRATNSDLAYEMNRVCGQLCFAKAVVRDSCKQHSYRSATRNKHLTGHEHLTQETAEELVKDLDLLMRRVRGMYYAAMAQNQGVKK